MLQYPQNQTPSPTPLEVGYAIPAPSWRRVPLWQGLLDAARRATVPGDVLLVEAGVPSSHLVVMEEGEAVVVVGEGEDELVTGDLAPGDHLGGRCLFGYGGPPLASVVTRGACRVRVLDETVLSSVGRTDHPGLCGLDALVLISLQVHRRTARVELSLVPAAALRRRGTPPPALPSSGLDAGLELLASSGRSERLPEGGVLFRPAGRDGRPEAFIVLSGTVRRLWRHPLGGLVELRPVLPGEIGGFDEALGFSDPGVELVAGPGATISRVPAARCLAALRSLDRASVALRRAMGHASAADLDDLRSRVRPAMDGVPTERGPQADAVVGSLELDQVLMLRATVSGFPGAV